MKCTGHRRDGSECGAWAMHGQKVCKMHGGYSPQARQAAKRRLLEAVDPVLAELIRLALHAKNESVRVRACVAALDRAGFGEPKRLEVTSTVITNEMIDREIARLEAELAEFDD